jgi:DNA-binding NarL/FixJ family response regulator
MILEPPTVERQRSSKLKTHPALVRVLLADDHERVMERATAILQPHFEIVGTASDGKMLVQEALRLEPDVIVSDILMPGLNGIDAVRELRQRGCKAKVVFLSVYDSPEFLNACLSAGASGYVTKVRVGYDLVHAINEATQGRQFISPTISRS